MAEETERLIRRQVRSPRSAALAGILFSLLSVAGMILLFNSVAASPADIGIGWLEAWSTQTSTALFFIPFAGIAFLWFTGVVRDLMGDLEDRFFSTVFLGSGIIVVVLLFIWAAGLAALFGTYQVASEVLADYDVFVYGSVFMDQILGNYLLRMAAVYMLSIGSLWTRTGVVPRWLTIVTYILGLGFLLFASILREARFLFPAWVLLVSVYILVVNYRLAREQECEEELSMDWGS